MNEIKNAQYQHNGSGTALLINKDYNHIPAREMYNDHKKVTEIIINQNKTRWILAGLHADNGNK